MEDAKGMGVNLQAAVIIIPILILVWGIIYFWTGSNQAFGIDCKGHVTDKIGSWARDMSIAGAQPGDPEQIFLGKSCVQYVTKDAIKFTDEPEPREWKNQFGNPIDFQFTGIDVSIAGNSERKLLPSDRPFKVQLSPPSTIVFVGA